MRSNEAASSPASRAARGGAGPGALPPGIRRLVVGELETNCYILVAGRNAAVIDPGAAAGRIEAALSATGSAPQLILLTHGHADHCGAVSDLLAKHPGCVVAASGAALAALPDQDRNLSSWMSQIVEVEPRHTQVLENGAEIAAGPFLFSVMALPGHAPGCVGYFSEPGEQTGGVPLLFAGDVLFRGSVGRTDIPGGSEDEMAGSLRRLAALPPATVVFPGHGVATTIAQELADNFFLRQAAATHGTEV